MKMHIAQKGLVFDKTKKKILAIKYLDALHNPEKLRGKYGLPGGKMNQGEKPEETLVREVKEETGITVQPLLPFYTWTWIYKKNEDDIQIVCTMWFATYKEGEITLLKNENETVIQPLWLIFENIDIDSFVEDEQPAIGKFIEYQNNNPFLLT